jgi:hypothetical protein
LSRDHTQRRHGRALTMPFPPGVLIDVDRADAGSSPAASSPAADGSNAVADSPSDASSAAAACVCVEKFCRSTVVRRGPGAKSSDTSVPVPQFDAVRAGSSPNSFVSTIAATTESPTTFSVVRHRPCIPPRAGTGYQYVRGPAHQICGNGHDVSTGCGDP